VLLDIVSIVDDGVHTGDLLLGHLSMLLDIVSIVDDGVHTGDLLLGHHDPAVYPLYVPHHLLYLQYLIT
jgi:predicted phosphoribosyltransferase